MAPERRLNSIEARAFVEAIERKEEEIARLHAEARALGGYEGSAAVTGALAFRKQSRMAFTGSEAKSAWEEAEWRLRQLDE